MNITCEKELLINNISIVSKAVAQKTTQPILECILLKADRAGFRLMANNLELSIETANMESDLYEVGSVALDARLFSNIIRSLPENKVSISVDENNLALIKSGRAEFKLMGQPGREFPEPPKVEKTQTLKTDSLTLKNIIKKTIFAVATEDTRPVLMGEFMEISPKSMNVVAIDGYRVAYRKTDVSDCTTYADIIVPAKTLNEISNILPAREDEFVNMYFTDRHALFEMASCTVVSRLIDGQYMEYKNLFNCDSKTVVTADRQEILSAIERATLIVKEAKKAPVVLEIKENNINITSRTELGEVFEQVNVDIEGEPLKISFNANYLADVFKNIDDERIKLYFMSPLSPCIIKAIEGEDYMYLVLPTKNI